MSIIQNLRDRAAWIISGAIAFALIVFVVEEGLRNKSIFGGDQNNLGKVNGQKIERLAFEERFKQLEDRYSRMGYPMDENTRAQQRDMLWNEYVEDAVMDATYDDLGLEVTEKEIGDILYGANPPQDLAQRFTDPKTGKYDANAAYQAIQQIKKQKNSPDYKSFFGDYVPALVKLRKKEKYDALINSSVYVPKWLVEKQNSENSQIASVSYVAVPYSTIADTSIKVTDADINAYVAKNKKLFKQEKSASISYVLFSGAPNAKDSAQALQEVNNVL
jgi:peptidyl-prolyl cis-trans isomerase D